MTGNHTHPIGVIHGRFQVLHNDHMRYLLAGRERCEHLVVGITNPDPSLTRDEASNEHRAAAEANPLTYFERYTMVTAALAEANVPRESFSVVPLPINLPELYTYYVPLDAVFFLTIYDDWGRAKRERFHTLGLNIEVLWERPEAEKGISASHVRAAMAAGEPWRHLVPGAVGALLDLWRIADRLRAQLSLGDSPRER